MAICSFFGHNDVYDPDIDNMLQSAVEKVVDENETVEFLVYQHGRFYNCCFLAALKARSRYPGKVTITIVLHEEYFEGRGMYAWNKHSWIPFCMVDRVIIPPVDKSITEGTKRRSTTPSYKQIIRWLLARSTHLISYLYRDLFEIENRLLNRAEAMHTLTIIDVSCSETVQAIANCVGHLPDRERLVYQAISAGHKCRCLTEQMGVNKSRVHQILSNGCRRIGEHLNWRYLKTLYTDKEKRLCSIFFADQITEDILKNFNAIIDFLIEVCEVRNFYIEASRSRSKLVTQIKRHSIPGRPLRILAIIDGAGSDTDAYMDFRHIDAVVIGLLIKLYTKKYAHWKPRTVLRRFFVQDGSHYIFALPDDPSCRVRRLAPLEIASHKPCPLKFNPYLDRAYYEWLQGRRGIQKATGKYHAIWTRQNGRCAYCEQSMLPDQEVELVEIVIGQGRHIGNLQYIHRQCAYDVRSHIAEPKEHINLFSILDGVVSDVSPDKSPYLELRNYFRLSKKSPITAATAVVSMVYNILVHGESYVRQTDFSTKTVRMQTVLEKQRRKAA